MDLWKWESLGAAGDEPRQRLVRSARQSETNTGISLSWRHHEVNSGLLSRDRGDVSMNHEV